MKNYFLMPFIESLRSLWISSRLQYLHKWQNSKRYWIWLRRLKVVRFYKEKLSFKFDNWLNMQIGSASIFLQVMQIILKQFIFVVILIISLEGIGRVLIPQIDLLIAPQFNTTRWQSLTFNFEIYFSFLSTLAQLVGIFLGLYFTATSVIASTVYAKASSDVRSLFVKEKGNVFYVQLNIFFIIMFIISYVMYSLNYHFGLLTISIISLLGISVILGFFIFGMRAFYFFDPSPLITYLISDLTSWLNAISYKGFKWQDPSFQAFYQRQTENALDTYYNIAQMIKKENLRREPLVDLAVRLLILLQSYSYKKSGIPSESYWFKRMYHHQDWLTTDCTKINMALGTSTAIKPETIPDMMWFEEHIEKIIISTMNALLEHDYLAEMYKVEYNIWQTLGIIAHNLAIDEAIHLFHALKPLIFTQAHKIGYKDITTNNTNHIKFTIGFLDLYGIALINILLGFSERITSLDSISFSKSISQINWDNSQPIYKQGFPRMVIERLEYIHRGLSSEKEIEGHIVSPLWYQQQLVAQVLIQFSSESIEKLINELEQSFTYEIDALNSEKLYVFAAQLIQGGLEACHKYKVHLKEMRSNLDGFNKFQKVKDIPWTVIEWEKIDKRIDIVHEKLIIAFSCSLISLNELEPLGQFQDYFGQGYSVIAEECYKSMAEGNVELFQKIFPSFFSAGWLAHDRILKQTKERDEISRIILSSEPIMDLIVLSGCAIAYTELNNQDYWNPAKYLWDSHYDKNDNPANMSKYIELILKYRRSIYAVLTLSTRDSIRFVWKQDLEGRLNKLYSIDNIYKCCPPKNDSETRCKNPLIKAIIQGRNSSYTIENIFIILYILKRPDSNGLTFTGVSRSFIKRLETGKDVQDIEE